MAPRFDTEPRARRRRSNATQRESLDERVNAVERRQRQLWNTLDAVARESGLSVAFPCTNCERSYMLVKDGAAYCPSCGMTRSL